MFVQLSCTVRSIPAGVEERQEVWDRRRRFARAAESVTERVGRERTDKLKKVKRICLFGEEINVERSERAEWVA